MAMLSALNTDKLLIVGSLNWNPEDREMERANMETVQVLGSEGFSPVPFFRTWGELGVSSFAVDPRNEERWFVSTGDDLSEVDLVTGAVTKHSVEGLGDVHEIDFFDGRLWLSNTGRNEAIAYDVDQKQVMSRICLNNAGASGHRDVDRAREQLEHFHLNQIFEDLSGKCCVLVHNTTGRQLIKRAAGKFIKSQGAGGVLELESGKAWELNLKAPHNVRLVGDEYWVCNSGHMLMTRFTRDWKKAGEFPTKGFGRGVALNTEEDRVYIGTSKTRKRYLGLFPNGDAVPNVIETFTVSEQERCCEIEVPNVEQISNIYRLNDRQYALFRALG